PLADVDEYEFAGTDGQVITVDLTTGTSFDLTLIGPDGKVVAGGGNNDRLLDLVSLPSDGPFVVRLEPAGGAQGDNLDDTGDYRFAVWNPTRNPALVPIS